MPGFFPAFAARRRPFAAERKVLAATLIGTTIEWYDFFIYAQAAGLVFAQLYFAPLNEQSAGLAQIVSWASIGISFLFRPLGAVVAGHLGDRIGRKAMLVVTLLMMGAATCLIGLLPTYAQIGLWAPLLLVVLRILQGFSAGGEWGGAALMAVEYAPVGRRGLFGAYPQIGVPVGMILASAAVFLLTSFMSTEQFLAWGWRIPFLSSIVLIVAGYFIRRRIGESPVFQEMLQLKKAQSAPLGQLFKRHKKPVMLTAFIFIANNATGYMLIAFFASYATKSTAGGGLGMNRPEVLLATTIASFGWLIFTLYGGTISDRLGRVRTFQIGYALLFVWIIPTFLLIDAQNIWLFGLALFLLTIGLGLSYGPMSAMYAEMFPVHVRYSGVSIGYALGAILGGAFAPTIAQALMNATGWSPSVGLYIMALCAISFIAVSVVPETKGNTLRPEA